MNIKTIISSMNATRMINSILLIIGLVFFAPLAWFVAIMMFIAGLTNYCLMEKILSKIGFKNTCGGNIIQTPKRHWEEIYKTKKSDEVSWYQHEPNTSLKLISETNKNKNAEIIDVGAGDSRLVDNLLFLGFKKITLLDVSPTALNQVKKRLGKKADRVKWVVSDLRKFETNERYDIWHDRATLHFLTEKEDVNKYVELVKQLLKPNGYLIVSAFSVNGPKKCSGLDVKQYSEDSIKKLFGDFEYIQSFEEQHTTPWGASQMFIFSVFRKGGKK